MSRAGAHPLRGSVRRTKQTELDSRPSCEPLPLPPTHPPTQTRSDGCPDICGVVAQHRRFCFQSAQWPTAVPYMVELTRVFRQSDQAFVQLLGEVRVRVRVGWKTPWACGTHPGRGSWRPQVREGQVSPGTTETLQALIRPLVSKEGIEPTKLYPTNNEVDSINTRRLNEVRAWSERGRLKTPNVLSLCECATRVCIAAPRRGHDLQGDGQRPRRSHRKAPRQRVHRATRAAHQAGCSGEAPTQRLRTSMTRAS